MVFCFYGPVTVCQIRVRILRGSQGRRFPLRLDSVLIPTQNRSKRLYFGRDPLGRRSLLIHKPTTAIPVFILCSVSARMPEGLNFNFEELASDHLFSLDLDILRSPDNVCFPSFRLAHSILMTQKPVITFNRAFQLIGRSNFTEGVKWGPFVSAFTGRNAALMRYQATVPRVNTAVPDDLYPPPDFTLGVPEYLQAAADGLVSQLQRSVMLQVKSITSLKYVKPSSEGTVLTFVKEKSRGSERGSALLWWYRFCCVGLPCG
jgi:hypothetical protein